MIVAFDVDYRDTLTSAAYVAFADWTDDRPAQAGSAAFPPDAAEYEPGQFFKRELGYLLALLRDHVSPSPSLVVVDGYAWLAEGRPGLGAHLFEALAQRIPVVGVAKRPFRDNTVAIPILRGTSQQPLFVTAAGMDANAAAADVKRMHGAHRLPTLLQRVDALARGRG